MARLNWREFTVLDPEVHHGGHWFNGTRGPLSLLIGSIADGMTIEKRH